MNNSEAYGYGAKITSILIMMKDGPRYTQQGQDESESIKLVDGNAFEYETFEGPDRFEKLLGYLKDNIEEISAECLYKFDLPDDEGGIVNIEDLITYMKDIECEKVYMSHQYRWKGPDLKRNRIKGFLEDWETEANEAKKKWQKEYHDEWYGKKR